MARTANVYAHIEPELKAQAEAVLDQIGVTPSSLITMVYKQVVFQGGIPFPVKVPETSRMTIEGSKEEIDAAFDKAYQSMLAGKYVSAEEVNERLQRKYDL